MPPLRNQPPGVTEHHSLAGLEQTLAMGRPVVFDANGQPYRAGESHPQFDARWPQPNAPLPPWYQPGAEPWQWYVPSGYNLTYLPRYESGASLTPFATLRAVADTVDILRNAIEHVKRQLLGIAWDIHPAEDVSQSKTSEIAAVKQWLRKPDGFSDFSTWLSRLIEEMLVTDAVSLYRWRTVGGDPLSMLAVDGATIKPLMDFHGIPPAPPEPAYQQVIMGRIETEFTREWGDAEPLDPYGNAKYELCYLRRSPRAWSAYGQSPVERVLMTVNLILRRQMHYLAFYTAGSLPDAIYKMPERWSTKQVAEYQEMWDGKLAGESEERRKLRFVPGDKDADLVQLKGQDVWDYQFEEFLARVVCHNFGISPIAYAKMVNRASSEQMDRSESEVGIRPLRTWIAEVLIGPQIREFLGYDGLRFIWLDDKNEDERMEYERHVAYVKEGILSREEVRDDLGLESKPVDGSQLMVDTATGPVPADGSGNAAGAEGDGAAAPGVHPALAAVPPLPAAGGGGAAHPALRAVPDLPAAAPSADRDRRGAEDPARDALMAAPTPPAAKAVREDLRRWRKVALADLQRRRAPRIFSSAAIPLPLKAALSEWIANARSAEDVSWGFSVLAKARRPLVAARRRIRLEKKLRAAAMEHFRSRAPHVAAVVAKHYHPTEKAAKAGPPDDEVDAAMAWSLFAEVVQGPLQDAYLDGETVAEDVSGIEGSFGLTSEGATRYASKRAAELVGMRRLDTGELVQNASARWSVPQTLRDQLRTKVEGALRDGITERQLREEIEGDAIWNWRADMIARTEVAYALNAGAVETYKGAGVEHVIVLDGPGCLEDEHDDSEPGVDGEEWTIEKADEYPIGHPNCRRSFRPTVSAAETGEVEED